MTDFMEQFSYNLLQGILKYSKETQPWAVTKMPTSFRQIHGLDAVLEWALKWKADAVIGQFESDDDLELFRRHGIVVLAQDYKKRFDNLPNITADYHQTGRIAANFFRSKGFVHYAFYGYKDVVWSDEREEGFLDFLRDCSALSSYSSYKKDNVDDTWVYDYETLSAWLKTLPVPTAILCCDDTSAIRLIETCQLAGIRVPDEISVLGVDNDVLVTQLMHPSLSSIDNDVIRAGYDAAKLIDGLVNHTISRGYDIIIHYRFIVERQSTDLFPSVNPYIAKILRHIDNNLSSEITVPELVSLVPMSRRLLEQKFKADTGYSIKKYIFIKRINKMSTLLVLSEDSIADISYEVGLGDTKNLSRKFSSVKGCTPSEYRMNNKL